MVGFERVSLLLLLAILISCASNSGRVPDAGDAGSPGDAGVTEERILACLAFSRCFKTSGFISCVANEPAIYDFNYRDSPTSPFWMTAAQTACLVTASDCIAVSECLTGPGFGGECRAKWACSLDGGARILCGPGRDGGGYASGTIKSCLETGAHCVEEPGLYQWTLCAAKTGCNLDAPPTCFNDRVIERCVPIRNSSSYLLETIVDRVACAPGQRCRDAGVCEVDPLDCAHAPQPWCDGTVLKACIPDAGDVAIADCAATDGGICWSSPFGRSECVTLGKQCESGYRACVGSEARFCDRGYVSALDCRKYGFSGCENFDCVH